MLDFFGGALSQLYYERVAETLMSANSGRLDFLGEHEAITDAVLAGDANAARDLMAAHMTAIQKRLDDYSPPSAMRSSTGARAEDADPMP